MKMIHFQLLFLTNYIQQFLNKVRVWKSIKKSLLKVTWKAPSLRDVELKTKSIRILSNFNFQWTKTLYKNNLNNTTFFLHFSRAIGIIYYSVITQKTISHGSQKKINVKFHKNCENRMSENFMCKMPFCEIWHSFSWAPIRNFLWCYYR